nr:hypothetical protein CFP56_29342 [Quercus suber]
MLIILGPEVKIDEQISDGFLSEVAASNPQQAEKGVTRSDSATASEEAGSRGVHSSDSQSLELVSIVNNGVQLSSSKETTFEAILEEIVKAIEGDIVQNLVEFPSIQTQTLNKAGVLEAVGSEAHSKFLQNSNTVAVEETIGSFALGWNESKDSKGSKLEAWNRSEFGHVGKEVARLQKQLEWLELQPTDAGVIQKICLGSVEAISIKSAGPLPFFYGFVVVWDYGSRLGVDQD